MLFCHCYFKIFILLLLFFAFVFFQCVFVLGSILNQALTRQWSLMFSRVFSSTMCISLYSVNSLLFTRMWSIALFPFIVLNVKFPWHSSVWFRWFKSNIDVQFSIILPLLSF